MKYVSTRGQSAGLSFSEVVLAGLAPDGGLYLPERWPHWPADNWRQLRGAPYGALAARTMEPYLGGSLSASTVAALCEEVYGGAAFRHPAVAPLVQMGSNLWRLDLHHGPTLAFKDFALQLVGRLFDAVLEQQNSRMTVVGATSGDTGSAAIQACRGLQRVDIVILHPRGRVSEVQRRQMTTVDSPNVFNVAVDGTFDDCQDLVKGLFADAAFRERVKLSAVNSINWARVLAQVVYYAHAALALGAPDRDVRFCVPTGNFGNVFAGWVAKQMGLPISRLVVASNPNDILARFFEANDMRMNGVAPSLSPSMDIQVSSNFERLLFELAGRDGQEIARRMRVFRETGWLAVPEAEWRQCREVFVGYRCTDEQTVHTIRQVWEQTGELVDPHTAVGIFGATQELAADSRSNAPMITLATAHPAKFPDAVEQATGLRPALPTFLADLFERPERCDQLNNDIDALKAYVLAHTRAA